MKRKNAALNHAPTDAIVIIPGLQLRAKAVHNINTGSHWTSSLLFSIVQELLSIWSAENDVLDGSYSDLISF